MKKIRQQLIQYVLLVIAVTFLTGVFHYVLSYIFYVPTPEAKGGVEVFLLPRYYLKQNDMTTGLFYNFALLFVISVAMVLILFSLWQLQRKKNITFSRFMVIVYNAYILLEFFFMMLTWNHFDHIQIQAESINNGIYSSLKSVLAQADFVSLAKTH